MRAFVISLFAMASVVVWGFALSVIAIAVTW